MAVSASLRVAVVQMKFRPAILENLERIVEHIHGAASAGAGVVLFPECAVTGYRREFAGLDATRVADGISLVACAAKSARCNVLLGTPTHRRGKWFSPCAAGRCEFNPNETHEQLPQR